jgi:peptide deformylase
MNLVAADDPILTGRAELVDLSDREISKISGMMLRMMVDNRGCGLAAPQVGLPLQMFTFQHDGRIGTVINPIIEAIGDISETQEGCLTYPGKLWTCDRNKAVRTSYRTLDGRLVENHIIEGFLAVIFQHETDHLVGRLISQHGRDERHVESR